MYGIKTFFANRMLHFVHKHKWTSSDRISRVLPSRQLVSVSCRGVSTTPPLGIGLYRRTIRLRSPLARTARGQATENLRVVGKSCAALAPGPAQGSVASDSQTGAGRRADDLALGTQARVHLIAAARYSADQIAPSGAGRLDIRRIRASCCYLSLVARQHAGHRHFAISLVVFADDLPVLERCQDISSPPSSLGRRVDAEAAGGIASRLQQNGRRTSGPPARSGGGRDSRSLRSCPRTCVAVSLRPAAEIHSTESHSPHGRATQRTRANVSLRSSNVLHADLSVRGPGNGLCSTGAPYRYERTLSRHLAVGRADGGRRVAAARSQLSPNAAGLLWRVAWPAAFYSCSFVLERMGGHRADHWRTRLHFALSPVRFRPAPLVAATFCAPVAHTRTIHAPAGLQTVTWMQPWPGFFVRSRNNP